MRPITVPIPALTGGVSTQPEPLRLPQQAQLSDNLIATVIEGLKVRPPTEYVKKLEGYQGPKDHAIHNPDGDYLVTLGTRTLQVYDLDPEASDEPLDILDSSGSALTPAALDYLDTPNPQQDLRLLTLSDYTLVLNRSKTVLESPDNTPTETNRALVAVVSGAYSKYYRIKVDHPGGGFIDVLFETHSSDGTPPNGGTGSPAQAEHSVKTDVIAKELFYLLTTGMGTGSVAGGSLQGGFSAGLPSHLYEVELSGSVISITSASDFDVEVTESVGGTSMSKIHKSVQLFTDLPTHVPQGMKVEVIGDPEQTDTTYWVEFQASDPETPVGQFADGSWAESVKPEIPDGLNVNTMPHALIRQADGKWQWTMLDGIPYLVNAVEYEVPRWAYRNAGDTITNRNPSWVGKTIRDMCFHEGRLGLLGEDGLLLSEAREPFNVYRTSVIDVIDSERIDLRIPTVHSEVLSHCTPVGGDVVLFSEAAQYVVRSEGPFAPNSVSMVAAGRHDCDPDAEPLTFRTQVLVPANVGPHGSIKEAKVAGDQRPSLDVVELSGNVPGYIGRIKKLATTPQLDVFVVLSDDAPEQLVVYTTYFQGPERVQQAWQTFTFGATVESAWFHDTTLYLALDYGDGVQLYQMRMAPAISDGGSPLTLLDRRLNSVNLALTYDPVLDRTEIVGPYELDADTLYAIEAETGKAVRVWGQISPGEAGARILGELLTEDLDFLLKEDGWKIGIEVDADIEGTPESTTLYLEGDYSETEIWVGYLYRWRHDMTKVHIHDERQVPISAAKLRLDTGTLYFDSTGGFEVHILGDRGAPSKSTLEGPYLGWGNQYQLRRLSAGSFKFPIRGTAEETRISLQGQGPWGTRLVSMDVVARLQGERGSRV